MLKAFSVEDLTVFKSQEVGFWVRAARVTFIGGILGPLCRFYFDHVQLYQAKA